MYSTDFSFLVVCDDGVNLVGFTISLTGLVGWIGLLYGGRLDITFVFTLLFTFLGATDLTGRGSFFGIARSSAIGARKRPSGLSLLTTSFCASLARYCLSSSWFVTFGALLMAA